MCQKYDCENKRRKNWVYEVRYLLNTLGLNYIWELQRVVGWSCVSSFGKRPIGLHALIKAVGTILGLGGQKKFCAQNFF